jgi:hypothetical protein
LKSSTLASADFWTSDFLIISGIPTAYPDVLA